MNNEQQEDYLKSKLRDENIDTYGLFIQYGIVEDYDSKETVYMSFFDDAPLEPRYYMFGK